MAATYTLIASNTLSSSQSSVTFSSIPQTYTDLVLKWSVRSDNPAAWDDTYLTFNNNTSNYSFTWVLGNGSTASSTRGTNDPFVYRSGTGAGATANTFGSTEIYIPNYTAAISKPYSAFAVSETNSATNNNIHFDAKLWVNTSAITSIKLETSAANYLTGSSFYLYGIKNS